MLIAVLCIGKNLKVLQIAHLLKPSLHLELLVSKFNNATAENHIDPENILLLNIMILLKCIILKYQIKIK